MLDCYGNGLGYELGKGILLFIFIFYLSATSNTFYAT